MMKLFSGAFLTRALVVVIGVLGTAVFLQWALLKRANADVDLAESAERIVRAALADQVEQTNELAARFGIEVRRREALEQRNREINEARVTEMRDARRNNEKLRIEIAKSLVDSDCRDVAIPGGAVNGLRAGARRANGIPDG